MLGAKLPAPARELLAFPGPPSPAHPISTEVSVKDLNLLLAPQACVLRFCENFRRWGIAAGSKSPGTGLDGDVGCLALHFLSDMVCRTVHYHTL